MSLADRVLGDNQKQLLRELCPLATELSFYLGGGTAIALHLGHRCSDDFDWFTSEEIIDPMFLASRIRTTVADFTVTRTDKGTLHGSSIGVRCSFLEYRYPLLRPVIALPEFGCALASLEDLSCMKLSAIAQRGSRRDFVDLFAICSGHIGLRDALAHYQQKYSALDVAHVLYGLTYFDDAEKEPMPQMLSDIQWPAMRQAIQGWVMDLGTLSGADSF